MAKASGLGRTTVQQIWRAFGLQRHRSETFKLSHCALRSANPRLPGAIYSANHAVRTLIWNDPLSSPDISLAARR